MMAEEEYKEKKIFYNHYADLSSILGQDADNLLPHLVKERIINADDKVVIENEPSPGKKASKMLNYISGPLEAGNKESFEKLLQIMVNWGTLATQSLSKKIMNEAGITPIINPVRDVMEAAPRSISSRTKPKIADLVNLVVPQAADKWEKICVQLIGDEHRHIVSTIRRDGHGSEDCCQRMFDQWLDLSKKPTWKDVIDALESGSVRKIALAEELKEHLAKIPESPPPQRHASPPPPQQRSSPPSVSPQQSHDRHSSSHEMVVDKQQHDSVIEPSEESTDQADGHKPAVILPQATITMDCGKGMVTTTVFNEIKRTVCRIRSPRTTGTGFIANVQTRGDEYGMALITNNHVIPTPQEASASRITFENVFPGRKCTLKGCDIFVKGKEAFRSSPDSKLDYTIIEIDESKMKEPETKKPLDIDPIFMFPTDIKTGDQVYVIQHPRGGDLAFSSSESTVLDPLLLYQCTTDQGSSGSPVLKEAEGDLKIVALHRGGRIGGCDFQGYNCGTLIWEIVNDLNGVRHSPLPTRDQVQQALTKK